MLRATLKALLGVLVVSSTLIAHGAVFAEEAPAPPASPKASSAEQIAIAESLFSAAKQLQEAERWEEAAAKFEASHLAAPSASALLNQGICFDRLGRTASAWAAFKAALRVANTNAEDLKIAKAKELLAEVEPRLSSIRVRAASPPPGLVLRRAGVDLGGVAILGTALPVDPGTFLFTAEAPGHEPFARSIELSAGKTVDIDVPALTPRAEPRPAPPPTESEVDPWLVGGAVGLGVGVAVLAVGATLGGLVLVEEQSLLDDPALCPNHTCSAEGLGRVEDARVMATASTAMLVGGSILALGGGGLFVVSFVTRSDASLVGLRVRGAF